MKSVRFFRDASCDFVDSFFVREKPIHEITRKVTKLRARILHSLPAHAVFSIFQDDAAIREFATNLVAPGEVAPTTRFLTFINQALNLDVQHLTLVGSENVEYCVKAFQNVQQFSLVFFK